MRQRLLEKYCYWRTDKPAEVYEVVQAIERSPINELTQKPHTNAYRSRLKERNKLPFREKQTFISVLDKLMRKRIIILPKGRVVRILLLIKDQNSD